LNATYAVDPDITLAVTLPGTFYCDEATMALSRKQVFARTWQWLGDTADVAQPGSVSPRDLLAGLLDEPLLLSRDGAGMLRCLSNVCTHRGNVLVNAPCHAEEIRCSYHARCFDLAGHMTRSPGFECAKNFPSAADDLPRAQLGLLGPHAFASIDPAADFEAFFGALRERVGWMPLERFIHDPSRDRDYHVASHWALYVENCLDGFHLPYGRPVPDDADDRERRCELFRYGGLQSVIAREGDDVFELPAASPDRGHHIAAYCFWVFPNVMLDFFPWGLSLNVVLPLGPWRTRVARRAYLWPDRQPNTCVDGSHEQAEMDLEALVEQLQRGMRSQWFRGGRYSPTRERALHHFHRLLCEFMSAE